MPEQSTVRVAIAGGGPAGMMLGFLLARAGIQTTVLEKHGDFLRDFRGDTIHPSTLEVMHELGLLPEFLKLPHQELPEIGAEVGTLATTFADFTHLPTHCRFVALMPQWDFLDFLAGQARRYPGFTLRMRAEAKALIEEGGVVKGLVAETPEGSLELRSELVVAADGRHSTMRAKAGLEAETLGAPMDVLWFRLSAAPGDPKQSGGRFEAGRIFVLIYRGEHWQCGYVIAKGSYERIRSRGLAAFRAAVAELAPFARDRTEEIRDWEDVKLLTVAVDRLKRWSRPGFLAIGDAAHAMSPIGGVGINLAIQDAVAAANRLAPALRAGTLGVADLERVQRRREWPTRVTQGIQLFIQNRVVSRVLEDDGKGMRPPLAVKLLARYPVLRRIPARVLGLGVRPEHIAI